jgi:hypothetical protein
MMPITSPACGVDIAVDDSGDLRMRAERKIIILNFVPGIRNSPVEGWIGGFAP